MKKNIITKLFFVAVAALGVSSCTEDYDSDSVITTWATSAKTLTSAASVDECSKVYTVTVTFDDKQITDLHLTIGVGESSTATEGEDFDLVDHTIDVPALAGQDGVSFNIEVYGDYEIEDDETVYITLTSEVPSGVASQEFLAFTINDSGLDAPLPSTADFALSWKYTNQAGSTCGYDLDLTFQTQGSSAYGDDLMGFDAASLACVEEGTVDIDDMEEGQLYDINIYVYAADDVALPLTVELDYDRAGTSFSGTMSIVGVFDSGMDGDRVIVGTIEKNCGIFTIKDLEGAVVGQGRVAPQYKVIHGVKKPF